MAKIEDLNKVRRAKAGTKGASVSGGAEKSSSLPRRRCPICGKAAVEKFRPFCSTRCADIDLGRWIGGDYRIAGTPANTLNSEDDEGEAEG